MECKPSPDVVVIVAEDEPVALMAAAEALTDAGFSVIEARNASQALDVLHGIGDRVDILVTDIRMPGFMDGLELARHARRRWPWIPVLLASATAPIRPADVPRGCGVLCKPYDPEAIVAAVRELLDGRRENATPIGDERRNPRGEGWRGP